jgi:Terminase small subunit
MTPRQERFIIEYLKDGNGAAAYRRAGYKPKTNHAAAVCAGRMLTNADIKAAIEAGKKVHLERVEEAAVTEKAWVIRTLRENVEKAMQARPVLDAAGRPKGEYRYDGAVVNRGCELIGKTLGMFDVKPPPGAVPSQTEQPPPATVPGTAPHVPEPQGSDRIAALFAEARAARDAATARGPGASN